MQPSAPDIQVEIIDAKSHEAPPRTLLEYEILAVGSHPVWLVDDGFLVWRQNGEEIELSVAREPLQPGAHPFGYFNPAVVKLQPGERVRRLIELRWPLSLARLWNEAGVAAPAPGRHQVRVRVGYGLTPSPDPPNAGESVEAPVRRWQREAISPPAEVEVPEYAP
jgi:hypothetical protein